MSDGFGLHLVMLPFLEKSFSVLKLYREAV